MILIFLDKINNKKKKKKIEVFEINNRECYFKEEIKKILLI